MHAHLQFCLDQAEQLEISIDEDQTVVRNFSRCELDFFFTEKLGGYNPDLRRFTPERQIVTNFRQMFSTFLPFFSSVLIHSSGVIRNGKAVLFLAPSTGGKTTVVGLSNVFPILSDDQVVLRKEDKDIIAHGSPLGQITDGPNQARLGGLFLLEKAENFKLEPVEPADMLQQLWSAQPNYIFLLPKNLRIRAFQILCDACHQVPVYQMFFPKDYVDWDAIDKAMEQ